MTDEGPKSAVELAMERLRKKDAEAGVSEPPLTDEQKARIADVRQVYAAKLAQEEILYRSKLATTWEPAERQQVDEAYRRDVQRLNDERDAKIAKIRAGA
ncbi:MAG: hypothetical protein AB1635_19515 [Acidobacteriota bacterium]